MLYDERGEVVAASRRDLNCHLPATSVSSELVQAIGRLDNAEAYVVEGFKAHPYYDDRPTYVYHAALRPDDGSKMVWGGIGLVFDSAVELTAMLDGALAGKPYSHACYADRSGCIIAASSNSGVNIGDQLPFEAPQEVWNVECGASLCRLVEHADELFIVACCASSGYREFKRTDGYRDEVLAVMWQALGAVEPDTDHIGVALNADAAHSNGQPYAIFACAGRLYAVKAAKVQEARPANGMLPITLGGGTDCAGMLTMDVNGTRALAYVYNLSAWLGNTKPRTFAREIIVLNDDGRRIGLLVDQLHSVGRHLAQPLQRTTADGHLIREVLQVENTMIPVLDTDALMQRHAKATQPGGAVQ